MSKLKGAFQEFEQSPCYSCSMISLMHSHTVEEAKSFKFGCEGEKFVACRRLCSLRLQGHPGDRGWDGEKEPTKDALEKMRLEDEIVNQAYWSEVRKCEAVLNGIDKTIW